MFVLLQHGNISSAHSRPERFPRYDAASVRCAGFSARPRTDPGGRDIGPTSDRHRTDISPSLSISPSLHLSISPIGPTSDTVVNPPSTHPQPTCTSSTSTLNPADPRGSQSWVAGNTFSATCWGLKPPPGTTDIRPFNSVYWNHLMVKVICTWRASL